MISDLSIAGNSVSCNRQYLSPAYFEKLVLWWMARPSPSLGWISNDIKIDVGQSHCQLQSHFPDVSISRANSVTRKKIAKYHKSWPKMISLEKFKILTPLRKLPKNVGDFGQINCCQRLWKVAPIPINRPIWSHCTQNKNGFNYFGAKNENKTGLSDNERKKIMIDPFWRQLIIKHN